MSEEFYMELVSLTADILGILGAFFSLFAWTQARNINQELKQERLRQNKKITVRLTNGQNSIELPIEFRRSEFSRQEILGRIGMIPLKKGAGRYSLSYLNKPEFLRRINEIANAENESVLEISCTNEELDQFNLSKN